MCCVNLMKEARFIIVMWFESEDDHFDYDENNKIKIKLAIAERKGINGCV